MLATTVEAMEQDKGPRKGKAAADDMKPTGEPPRKCPRCDSRNTKFCYYNNYSSSQPRYICRACRRYWTEGGALRNLPRASAAAARRASKHTKRSSSTSITAAGPDAVQAPPSLFFSGLGGGFLRLPPAIPELLNPSLMLGPPPTPPVLGLPMSDEGDQLFNDLFGGVQDASDQAPRPPPASSGPFV